MFGVALIFLVELLVGDSFEFKASGAKIDEQPDFQIIRLQVVDCLCQMNIFQLDKSFQLYTDNIAHQKIHPSRPDVLAFVVNRHDMFTAEGHALIHHLDF